MTDHYSDQKPTIDSVLVSGFSITPDNVNNLSVNTRALYIGNSGNVRIQTVGFYNQMANTYTSNTVLTLLNVPTGALLPIRAMKVYASGTTANNIVGFY